ncbi:DUF2922 domain-containing protein [Pelosinus sp. sgz500959]|uniref:DUF2922 domain-containing protein n=1 Tax=Pelosinus sp. sgz500959 TaxID=3242472 RepID=UPI003672C870
MKKVLEMHFRNETGKEVTILVNDPKEDLTALAVNAVMQTIITKNLFSTTSGDLVQIVSAQLRSTDVAELA